MRSVWRTLALAMCCMATATCAWGQLKPLGDPKVDKFPTVVFQVNDRNPVQRPAGDFKLQEAEQEPKFTVEVATPSDSGVGSSILLVWEYLPAKARDTQNKFFRQLILNALPKLLPGEEGTLNVATFAWTGKEKGAKTLNFLGTGFGKDTAALAAAVRTAKAPGGKGIDEGHGSELYPALSEGVAALAATPAKARVLLVLSAEFPNIHNQNVDVSMVKDQARKADVAIYNLRFKQMSDKYTLDQLARDTYGLSYEVHKDLLNAATDTLVGFATGGAQRSLGLDYTFTFESTIPKDGKTHTVQLIAGQESIPLTYNAPSKSFGEWVGDHLVLVILLVVMVVGGAVVVVLLLRKRSLAEAARRAEQQRKLEEMQSKGRENEQRIQQQNQQLSQLQREEQERSRKAAEDRRREENAREMKALLTEMYANGRQPRLTTVIEGQPLTMELPSAVTTVGRDASCEIQVQHPTISRNHFQIIYQGGKYTLLDMGSTNGTRLNGARVQQAELRHGDQIMAGEALLHFYL